MNRYFALSIAVALAAGSAWAINDTSQPGACCIQSTSALDAKMNPTKGSDENFFTSAGGPPNVLIMLDTSCSMNAWAEDWPTAKGCGPVTHPGFAGLGYDKTVTYRGFISGMTGPSGAKVPTVDTDWFDNTKVYEAQGSADWNDGSPYGHNFANSGAPTGSNWTTATNACNSITGISAGDKTACETCLADYGYYVYNSSTRRVSGNFLNFHAPRDSGAVIVLSQILFEVREVRMAVMTFEPWGGGSPPCWSNDDLCKFSDFEPTCNKSYPIDQSAVENNRNSLLNKLAGNNPFTSRTPLASMLYAGAHWLRNLSSTTPSVQDGFIAAGLAAGFPTSANYDDSAPSTGNRSVCGSCGFNAVVMITDGDPNSEIITPPAAMVGTQVATCTGGSCGSDLDEIARWMWQKDLRADYAGTQRVATYTVGLATGTDATGLLSSTAKVGGGKFFGAQSSSQLKDAIMTILSDVVSRNTSFSSAAVTSVQSSGQALAAVLPRLQPRRDEPWQGRLWRFTQYNEFVEDVDYNADSDKADIFVIDSVGSIVVEDSDGNFVKKGTSTAAQPYWEGNARILNAGHGNRKIWTVIDSNNDGAFTDADNMVELTTANVATLLPYLGIIGTGFCPTTAPSTGTFLAKLNVSNATAATATGFTLSGSPTQSELDTLCGMALIQYIRGQDLGDADGDGNRTETRDNVLGDVFHSSPVAVNPPLDSKAAMLCDLGLNNQCVRTLYSETLGVANTPLATGLISNACFTNKTVNAYWMWANTYRSRDSVVLVGANDGMLHAFHNGNAGAETCSAGFVQQTYSNGSGDELWAFIPPDLLPRLQDQLSGHAYYVDGDIMVRDIWADGTGGGANDNTKQQNEFHTMAVISEGRGGTHYLGLELTFNAGTGDLDNKPAFKWMFPQPCSDEASLFGKTLFSLSPKPPPIGPILLQRNTVPGAPGSGTSRYGVDTVERWIVALSGGWSPALEKGRGIYLVDAYRGIVNTNRKDNLIWKMELDESGSSEQKAPLKAMTHSVTAPVALVDYGTNAESRQDGFFDTAVVGDTGGKVWLARLSTPGKLDSNAPYLVTNWSGARAFDSDREGLCVSGSTTDPLDPADPSSKTICNDNSFYYLPSTAAVDGELRVFIGSGNRYALLEKEAGTCRFDNPVACAKYRCDEVKVVYKIKKNTIDIGKMETHWKARKYEHGKLDRSTASEGMCGSAGGTAVTAEFSDYDVKNCDTNGTGGNEWDPGTLNKVKYTCGLNAASTAFTCQRVDGNARKLDDLFPSTDSSVDTDGLGKNRFFGFWAYGGSGGRTFIEDPSDTNYSSSTSPKNYDLGRITDRTSALQTSGDLVNVTGVSCTGTGVCSGAVGDGGWGWVYDYGALEDKTASGSALLASCVLWSNLSPTAISTDAGACAIPSSSASAIFQADLLTGYPDCAYGFKPPDGGAWARSASRNVVSPPPEPASTIQVSKTGQVKYSAMILEPGKDQATTADISAGQDVLQAVSELPVSRSLHECRHGLGGDGGCVTVP